MYFFELNCAWKKSFPFTFIVTIYILEKISAASSKFRIWLIYWLRFSGRINLSAWFVLFVFVVCSQQQQQQNKTRGTSAAVLGSAVMIFFSSFIFALAHAPNYNLCNTSMAGMGSCPRSCERRFKRGQIGEVWFALRLSRAENSPRVNVPLCDWVC